MREMPGLFEIQAEEDGLAYPLAQWRGPLLLDVVWPDSQDPVDPQVYATVEALAAISYDLVSQAEAEAGTATTRRIWSALRVKEAILALAPSVANMVQSRIKGRAAGAGTGSPQDLTPQEAAVAIGDVRAATLSAADTLTTASALIQLLDPNGANRDVTLPATGRFVIRNISTGAFALVVKNAGGTTLATIRAGVSVGFASTAADTWSLTQAKAADVDVEGAAIAEALAAKLGTGNGAVGTANLADAAVTLAKMANLAQATILGRAAGAGNGPPSALSAFDARTAIDAQGVPVVPSGNVSTSNGWIYHNVGTSTYFDVGSPEEGKGFIVRVLAGTATVGGTAYSVAGTVLHRFYQGGVWQTVREYLPLSSFGAWAYAANAAAARTNLGVADEEIYLPADSFTGPWETGATDDCGRWERLLDDGTRSFAGVGCLTSNATQQQRYFEATVRVPAHWTAWGATGSAVSAMVMASSATSTDCKYDLAVRGVTSGGVLADPTGSETNLAVSSANVPQVVAISGALSGSLPAFLRVRVTCHCRNGLGAYFAGVRIRGVR
jgi:hypothetical protein